MTVGIPSKPHQNSNLDSLEENDAIGIFPEQLNFDGVKYLYDETAYFHNILTIFKAEKSLEVFFGKMWNTPWLASHHGSAESLEHTFESTGNQNLT